MTTIVNTREFMTDDELREHERELSKFFREFDDQAINQNKVLPNIKDAVFKLNPNSGAGK